MKPLKNILLIESELQEIEQGLKLLGKFPTNTKALANGREAFDFLFNTAPDETFPDLILLGLRLPEMDGLQLLRAIRSSERTCGVPVIFLTNSIHERHVLESFKLGSHAFLVKPLSYAKLVYALLAVGLTVTDGILHRKNAF